MFKHLEDGLSTENDMQRYLEVHGKLQEPTRTVLPYVLDIVALLEKNGLNDQYALFGGYAVLSHLMRYFGESTAISWRGSTDIDMAGTQDVLRAIHRGLEVHSDLASPNIPNKRTVKLADTGEEECRVDFYGGDFTKRFGAPVRNVHFGIGVQVVEPRSLIRSKLFTPLDELQHSGDILGLLSVLEREGYAPEQIASFYTSSEVCPLIDRISSGLGSSFGDRMALLPSTKYLSSLRKKLHKRRPA